MRSLSRWAVRRARLAAAFVVLTPGALAAIADDAPPLKTALLGDGAALYLEVIINGRAIGLVAAFTQDAEGTLRIAPDELAEIGLKGDAAAASTDGAIDIAQLPGVEARYDEAAQRIFITAPDTARLPQRIEVRPEMPVREATSDPGAVLNYALYAAGGRDERWRFEGASALLEGRVFGVFGMLSGAVLARSDARGGSWRRLDTTWTWNDPSGPTRYSAGDMITGALSWTRPVRLGGLQVRRAFALRPDMVTQPMAELRGSADVPSTVEVYVDGAQRATAEVPAGPFEVSNVPLVTGAGTARVVVRDALGRESVTETPFFAASNMLAEGLFDFSAEIGFARRDFGGEEDSYDNTLFASGSLRYGLSDALTLEGHSEGGGGLVMGGAGFVARMGSLGAVSFAVAGSRYAGETGTRLQATLEMDLGGARLFALSQRSSDGFADIASVSALPEAGAPPRALDQVALSLPEPWPGSSLTLSYTRLDRADEPAARIVAANFSQSLPGDATLFVSAFGDLGDSDGYGVFAGISVPLSGDISAGGTMQADSSGSRIAAEITRAESGAPDSYGWRVRAGEDIQAVSASYRAPFARVQGSVWRDRGDLHGAVEAEGAVALTGGGLFISPRIDDAFAVVETGVPGVEVLVENRPAGRTDASGRLLVPGLRAYEANRVSINPGGLPAGADIGVVVREVTPEDRAGVTVAFDVNEAPAAGLATLRDEAGIFIEAGAVATPEAGGRPFVVGYEGQVYLTGLSAENRVTVTRPGGATCLAVFAFARSGAGQMRIGDVICRPMGAGS